MTEPPQDVALIDRLNASAEWLYDGHYISDASAGRIAQELSEAAAALAAMAKERDDAVRRMEQGWVQVCAEPAIKGYKEAAEQAERELAEAVKALERARDALYNGFEPDNQSRAWHTVCAAIDAARKAGPA